MIDDFRSKDLNIYNCLMFSSSEITIGDNIFKHNHPINKDLAGIDNQLLIFEVKI